MEAIASPLPRGDGVACFTRLYLAVTQGVEARLAGTVFQDPRFLERLDVAFADLFFDAVDAPREGSEHDAACVAAAVRVAGKTRDRPASVRSRRYERAHQPRPAGRARLDLPRARHRPRGGLAAAPRLRDREHAARGDRDAGEAAVRHRLAPRRRPARAPGRPHRRRRRDVGRRPRARRRVDERRGALGDPRRRGARPGVPRLARPDGRLRGPRPPRARGHVAAAARPRVPSSASAATPGASSRSDPPARRPRSTTSAGSAPSCCCRRS